MRRSHVYDECKNQTRHKWNTQYVGGNKLAVCNGKDLHNSATCFCAVFSSVTLNSAHFPFPEASFQISGTNSAYFPRGQDCLTTTSSNQLRDAVLKVFTDELKAHGVDGQPQHECLVCGRTWAGVEIYCAVLWVLKFINCTKHFFFNLSSNLTVPTKEALSTCFSEIYVYVAIVILRSE